MMADVKKGGAAPALDDMDDEVQESEGAKSKPKKGAGNKPKAKKGAKPKAKKSDIKSEGKKKGKKSGGGAFGLFVFILLVLAVVGGYVLITYNMFEARDILIETVNSLDPAYVTYQNKLLELESRDSEVTAREEAVKKEEQRLAQLKSSLDKKEAELSSEETSRVPIYRQPLSEQNESDMNSLAKVYANMEPATAATIIANLYSIEDMAAILYFMSEKNAAAILAEMRTSLAASVTDLLLRE